MTGQLYLYAKDAKLSHARIDPDSVREIEDKSTDNEKMLQHELSMMRRRER